MRIIVLALLFFAQSSCEDKSTVEPDDEQPPTTEQTFTYLALGDSYTIGHSVAENGRFPVQLADTLRAAGLQVTDPKIIATTGWTTSELQEGIEKADINKDTFSMVSLLIGVNNQFRGNSIEVYKKEFEELLNQAIDFAGKRKDRVFVVSIPDYAFTPFGQGRNPEETSKGVDEFNAASKKITDDYGILYIDITPISREGLDDEALVASDGLHPSAKQYGRWVSKMKDSVIELLK